MFYLLFSESRIFHLPLSTQSRLLQFISLHQEDIDTSLLTRLLQCYEEYRNKQAQHLDKVNSKSYVDNAVVIESSSDNSDVENPSAKMKLHRDKLDITAEYNKYSTTASETSHVQDDVLIKRHTDNATNYDYLYIGHTFPGSVIESEVSTDYDTLDQEIANQLNAIDLYVKDAVFKGDMSYNKHEKIDVKLAIGSVIIDNPFTEWLSI